MWKPFKIISVFCVLCFIFLNSEIQSQVQQKVDSAKNPKWIKKLGENKKVKNLLGLITHAPEKDISPFLVKSEEPYLPYEGKIIRKIIINRLGFDKIVLDTASNFQSWVARTANKLHANSREFVIRNNVFVKENRPLNPYRLADNERLLRSLDFIMDARIFVRPIKNSPDSVDLLVVTRDVFSLSGAFDPTFPTKYQFSIQDINFKGLGQSIRFGQVFDLTRSPQYGYQGFYQIVNIKGSFIDGSIGYTNLNTGVSIGNENESSFYLKFNRALFQPFTRWAGAVELSDNISRNVFKKPDSSFAQYHYRLQDYWAGYSFGYRSLPNDLRENRNRKFISLRGFDQSFVETKNIELTQGDRFVYHNKTTLLAQLTFFRQDFYKTQFVVGFGRTEDIPYGYRLSFTTGWESELGIKRSYFGGEASYSKVRSTGTILTYNVKLGSYWGKSNIEDGLVSFDFSRYSKTHQWGKSIVRHQSLVGYAAIIKQVLKRGIDIRDANGILGFLPDSLFGYQRIVVSQEATVFVPLKVLGFRMAPVVRVDMALLKRDRRLLGSEDFFLGISGGLRARNENLIFNTIEIRCFYFPITVERVSHFRLNITTNFRIKYPSNLVSKPTTFFSY